MTSLDSIRALPDVMISPEVAAKAIGCKPQSIRVAARTAPERLGFPVTVIGRRTLIPRLPFIQYLEGCGCG